MKPLCDNREYDPSHHVEHTKQAASLQSQLTNQQRHLYGKVANNLDNCLLTLADGHDHVMKAMIGELRDIVDSGYVKTFNPATVIHQEGAP